MDKIQPYRQPIVTATGILLGFILNFGSSSLTNAFSKQLFREYLVSIGLALSATLLLVVMYRVLNMHYPKDRAEQYYKRTLFLFITGISIPFILIITVMIEMMIFSEG